MIKGADIRQMQKMENDNNSESDWQDTFGQNWQQRFKKINKC